MKARCSNPNHPQFRDYGGRGIRIAKRWMSYDQFYADMGERPEGMCIERIDNNGHYEPSNCEWVTRQEQNKNKRSVIWLTHNGETRSLCEWAEHLNAPRQSLYMRYRRGWSAAEILDRPVLHEASHVAQHRKSAHRLTYQGKTQSLCQWADEYGIKRGTFGWRIKHGRTIEQALGIYG